MGLMQEWMSVRNVVCTRTLQCALLVGNTAMSCGMLPTSCNNGRVSDGDACHNGMAPTTDLVLLDA